MTNTGSASFDAEGWVLNLSRYADGLITCLEANLWALSGTGIPLKAESRAPMTIERYRPPEKEADDRRSVPESPRASDQRAPLDEALPDLAFFQKWLDQPDESCRPLALIAPFGCGKSVTLAMFALTLARKLKEWCDLDVEQRKSKPMPWVPFPVRLRAWPGKLSLWAYMVKQAQQDIDEFGTHLSDSELRTLLGEGQNPGQLLPLFDGLDELAEDHGVQIDDGKMHSRTEAIQSILNIRQCRSRHIISSRPGHGLETGGYAAHATFHTLQELDETAAEQFIVRSIPIVASQPDHPILRRYRDAQPAINELFRRPLFLAAWCDKAKLLAGENANLIPDLPTTVSGLMKVVLEEMLRDDRRVVQPKRWDDPDFKPLWNEALNDPRRLGAVLALHADTGFGRLVGESDKAKAISDKLHPHAFADLAEYKKYERFALHTGLLLGHHGQTYVQKIPVVEYLIGYYYAWLAGEKPADPKSAQQQLVRSFQRRISWRDHNEIWLHAFDLLWQGSMSQGILAHNLVKWVLQISQACINTRVMDPSIHGKQSLSDHEFTELHHAPLRLLPPTTCIAATNSESINSLVHKSLNQLKILATHSWQRGKPFNDFSPAIRRHSQLVVDWLVTSATDEWLEDFREAIIGSLAGFEAYLNASHFHSLLGLVSKCDNRKVRECVRSILLVTCAHIGRNAIEMVFTAFEKFDDAGIRWDLIHCLHRSANQFARNDTIRLLRWLPENKRLAGKISEVISRAAHSLSESDLTIFLCFFDDPRYEDAWDNLADTAGRIAANNRTVIPEILVDILSTVPSQSMQYCIGRTLRETPGGIHPSVARRLADMLNDDNFESIFDFIATTIGKAIRSPNSPIIPLLISRLNNSNYSTAWPRLASAISHSAILIRMPVSNRLLRMLRNDRYSHAWDAIISACCRAVTIDSDLATKSISYCMAAPTKPAHLDAFPIIGYFKVVRKQDVLWMISYLERDGREARLIANTLSMYPPRLDEGAIECISEYLQAHTYDKCWLSLLVLAAHSGMPFGSSIVEYCLNLLEIDSDQPDYDSIMFFLASQTVYTEAGNRQGLALVIIDNARKSEYWSSLALIPLITSLNVDLIQKIFKDNFDLEDATVRHNLKDIATLCCASKSLFDAICAIASEAIKNNNIGFAKWIAHQSHRLVVYEKNVNVCHKGLHWVEHDVAGRDDVALRLCADKLVTPALILDLLAESPNSSDLISNMDILPILRDSIEQAIGIEQAAAFAYKFYDNNGRFSEYLNKKAIPEIIKSLGAAGIRFKVESEDQKELCVSQKLLERSLLSGSLVRLLYDLALVDIKYIPFWDAKHPGCVFISPCCAAIHERQTLPEDWWDKAGSFIFRPYACVACKTNTFQPPWRPAPEPKERLWCHSCKTAFDAVLHKKLKGGAWRYCPATAKSHLKKSSDTLLKATEPQS